MSLAIAFLDVGLQWGKVAGYDFSLAEKGAQSGLAVSLGTLALTVLYADWGYDRLERRKWVGGRARLIVRPVLPLGVFVAINAVSVVLSNDPALGAYQLALLLETLLLVVYIVNRVDTRTTLDLCLGALLIGGIFASGTILASSAVGLQFDLFGLNSSGPRAGAQGVNALRFGGTFGSAVTAAAVLELLLPLSLAVLLATGRRWLRYVAIASLIAGIPALAITGSRAGWAATVLSTAIVLAVAWRRQRIGRRSLVVGAAAALVLVVPAAGIVTARLTEDDRGSAQSRVSMIWLGFRIVKDRPLTGVGLNNVGVATPDYVDATFTRQYLYAIHDRYLLSAAEAGVLAFLAFLWVLVAAVRNGARVIRAGPTDLALLAAGLTGAIAGQAVHMTVDVFQSRRRSSPCGSSSL